jgi:sigma-B regulation protein RsbU (phosphoserine phosphatase)
MQRIVTELAQNRANILNLQFSSIEVMTAGVAAAFEHTPPTSAKQLQEIWTQAHPALTGNSPVFIVFDAQYAATNSLAPAYLVQRNFPGRGGPGGEFGQITATIRGMVEQQRATGGRNPGGRGGGRGGGPRGSSPFEQATLIPIPRIDATNEPFFTKAVEEKKAVWCDPQVLRVGEPIARATYSVPILSGDKFLGVVVALANTNLARSDIGSTGRGGGGRGRGGMDGPPPGEPPPGEFPGAGPMGPPTTEPTTIPYLLANGAVREFTIIGGAGSVISPLPAGAPAGAPILEWAKAHGQPELAEELQGLIDGAKSDVQLHRIEDIPGLIPEAQVGEAYWVAFASIPATDWVVTAAISEPRYMGPVIATLRYRSLYMIGGLILLLTVTTLVSIRISRPIERMAVAVNQLASGDLEAQVKGVHSHDELGQLAGAFNTMTRQLRQHVAALTEQTKARESVEAEMRIARQIQTDLLPRTFPPFPGRTEFSLHAVNVPAKRVAGDFYDFFFASGDVLTVAIADVSGKGMPAALLMAVTRTIIRNLAMAGLSPAQIIERANAMLVKDLSDSMFVTLFLCQYDTRSGAVTYVNAGHPLPYRFGPDGVGREFGEVTGPILGVNSAGPEWTFRQQQDQLSPGEMLLLYTDGVTEARAPDGTMLRAAGLESLITKYHDETVESICARIVDEVNQFQKGQPVDDITLVALRRNA